MSLIIYAVLHFLVDFVCAWAMFGYFRWGENGYLNILIYNFCAFALQMPFGTLLDLVRSSTESNYRRFLGSVWTGVGIILTVVGAAFHPAVLGIGNALFHVGGGMDVITGDFSKNRRGRDLGIFVAPGAIGLFLGTRLGKNNPHTVTLIFAAAVLVVLYVLLIRDRLKKHPEETLAEKSHGKQIYIAAICCFIVVILRSWVGLAVTFPWKGSPFMALLGVISVAAGKVSGGILSAGFGIRKTVLVSLILAAGCFLLGEIPVFGMAALVLFNMSMPVTLYLLAAQLPHLAGFSFGLLTFGLFLGFLPVYADVGLPVEGTVFGALGSLISLLLLMTAIKAVEHDTVSA